MHARGVPDRDKGDTAGDPRLGRFGPATGRAPGGEQVRRPTRREVVMAVAGAVGALGELPALRLRHRARPAELGPIRALVQRWAERNAVPADVLVDLQLSVGEAVSNGVEHAYPVGAAGTV